MAQQSKSRKAASPSRKSASRGGGGDVMTAMQKLGVDESVVDLWREQMKSNVAKKMQSSIEEFDVDDAINMAKRYASMSSEKLKEVSKKNPKAFYGGLAAILVGAGLLAAAVRPPKRSSTKASSTKSTAD